MCVIGNDTRGNASKKTTLLSLLRQCATPPSVMQLRSSTELQESQYVLKTSNTIYLLPVWHQWRCENGTVGGAFSRLHQLWPRAKPEQGLCWVKKMAKDEKNIYWSPIISWFKAEVVRGNSNDVIIEAFLSCNEWILLHLQAVITVK